MFSVIISGTLLVFLGVALYPIGKLAKRKGDSPAFWRLLTLISWGFVWVGVRMGIRIWSNESLSNEALLRLVLLALILCSIIYLGFWIFLSRKSMVDASWEEKLSEIGKEKQKE
ncbi:MAG: hypothetical protein AAF824_12760 [Bacteroidota bacterium]